MANKNFKDELTKALNEVLAPNAEWGCCRVFDGKAEIFTSFENRKLGILNLMMMAIFNTVESLEMDPIIFMQELQKMFEDTKTANP